MNSFDCIEVSTIGVSNNIYVYLKCRFSDCLVVTFFTFFLFYSYISDYFQLYLYSFIHLPLSHLSPYHPALHMFSISQTPSELLHNSDIHPSHVSLQLLPKCPLLQALNNI